MPESPPLDVLCDVSEGLKALSILVEDWGDSKFPTYGVGVILRLFGEQVDHAVRRMPEPAL